MKNTRSVFISSVVIFLIILIMTTGCSTSTNDTTTTTSTTTTTLATVTVEFKNPGSSGNWIRYYTNDSSKLDPKNGYSVWTYGSVVESTMNEFTAEMVKVSGSDEYGYGMIFCVQDDENYLLLLIDNNREYLIGKVIGGELTDEEWVSNTDLCSGYNKKNKASIKYLGTEGSQEHFSITFNDGTNTVSYYYNQATGEPLFSITGRYGYIVTCSPLEDFPNTPVDVWFNQITPDPGTFDILASITGNISTKYSGLQNWKVVSGNIFK